MDNRPIGVFDSGLGGLTAVKEMKKILPKENILYFGDTGRVPYGTRSKEILIKYATQDMNFLMKQDVKAVVAACGTVSSVAQSVGLSYNIPYIDVITPTAIAAVRATKNKRIGVIGTSATIRSKSFVKAISSIDSEIKIFAKSCTLFVPLVENGFVEDGDQVTELVAERYLKELREENVDTLILGCTHFPILTNAISKVMGESVTLIDSGKETAHYLSNMLRENNLLSNREDEGENHYYVSDTVEGFASVAKLFLGNDIIGDVTRIDIEEF